VATARLWYVPRVDVAWRTGATAVTGDDAMSTRSTACCPVFDPAPWNEQEITWYGKLFVKDRVRSFLHIPLNFPAVMKRNIPQIEAAGALPDPMIVLADENSLWGADVYIEVTTEVAGATMTTLSGTFLTKVFEGPFRDIRSWIQEMSRYVAGQGKEVKQLYFYYTTCPKCAKLHGKNYVVLLARV
jgi:hypothetical protein